MRNLLLPIDADGGRTRAAVAEALGICAQEPVHIHLLSVQPLLSSHVAMFFGEGELQQTQLEAGAEDLAPARALLDASAVSYTATVKIGRSAETIARFARERGCDRIVMGREDQGLAGKIFGSLAQQVRHLLSGASDCQVIGS
jgi:nucleotide-binding universal stress UspA family protein